MDLNERIAVLAGLMHEAKRLVVFTGAGISTESGLPDFRGPNGLWTKKVKVSLTDARVWAEVKPNAGHLAILELQKLERLKFLISQNVDNLHLKSGIRAELLAELHGNLTKIRCNLCEFKMDNFDDNMCCPVCGGTMIPSVVDFGQSLPQKDVAKAISHSQDCDLFIVVGSSLVVYPAADMPQIAVEYGAKLVIINQGETPLDEQAYLRFEEAIGQVLPPAVAELKRLLNAESQRG